MNRALPRRHFRKLAVATVALLAGSLFIAPRPSFATDLATDSIANRQNGLCISNAGVWVLNFCDQNNAKFQLFTFDAPDRHGAAIRQANTNRCIGQQVNDDGTLAQNVLIVDCASAGPSARWTLIFVGSGGHYRIQNAASRNFLDGANNLLRVRPNQSGQNQQWRIFHRAIIPI